MTYKLIFKPSASDEWKRLDGSVKEQFKKVLAKRLEEPRVESARLTGMKDCYKIKLRTTGYRLVYQVDDGIVTVTVIAVGRRDKNMVYEKALRRL
jgi:mRNA interferase RelE/StbE